jgi:hypothetical protein
LDGKVKGINFKSFREVKKFDFINESILNIGFDIRGNSIIPKGQYQEIPKYHFQKLSCILITYKVIPTTTAVRRQAIVPPIKALTPN